MQLPQLCTTMVLAASLAFAVAQTADQYFTNNAKKRMQQEQEQPQPQPLGSS